ncbi:MAG: alpha/beta hydrolase [Lentimonas sp.]
MKTKGSILALILMAAGNAFALTAKERADQAYEGHSNIVRDLQYKTAAGFDDPEQLSMDLILPEKNFDDAGAPVVLFIHGGGWSGGERYVLDRTTFKSYTDAGIAVACISYRLAKDGYSALDCLIDCKDAARFLVKNAEKYGLDPNCFATRGHSAGGHLALSVALVPDEAALLRGDPSLKGFTPRFASVVAEAPLTTLLHPEQADRLGTITTKSQALKKILGGTSSESPSPEDLMKNDTRSAFIAALQSEAPIEQVARVLSPEFWLEDSSPPILLVHGSADSLISVHGARYFKRLADERGAEVVYVEVKNGNHSFRSLDPQTTTSHSLKELHQLNREFTIKNMRQVRHH